MLRESRYSGQEPPPKSWKGWQKVAVMAGLKDGVKDGVTAAIEAVASAQAQQAAILAGEVAAVEPEELPAPTPPRAVRETRSAEPARLERQRVTEVDDDDSWNFSLSSPEGEADSCPGICQFTADH